MSDSSSSALSHHPLGRRQGVLLHITSLPSPEGIGGIGAEAHQFLRWLHRAGSSAWQILPTVPIGAGHSPYSSSSAFAGNPLLISVCTLKEEGWLTASELEEYLNEAAHWGLDEVQYETVKHVKTDLLNLAADRFLEQRGITDPEVIAFQSAEESWLNDAALFDAISQKLDSPWWTWPITLRDRQDQTIVQARQRFTQEINRFIILQFWFQKQWDQLRSTADQVHVELIGDVPIYVDHNSADVWANPQLFALQSTGEPKAVAGVPPDAFSETGQLWGSPLYSWDHHEETGYHWWSQRLSRALRLTHRVRIDHFRAFAAYWSVPYGSTDARGGEWIDGPGVRIFEALENSLPRLAGETELPLIAEDLGLIDEPVRDLLRATRLPGMKVLQFAFDGDQLNDYLPHNYSTTRSVVYTGTHDNQTTRGWWEGLDERTQDQVRRYCACAGHPSELSWDLIRLAFMSIAELAIIPLQDLLALGDDARMNKPSQPEGNWAWRVRLEALNEEVSQRLRELSYRYGRSQ